jgi:hypothetical protein
MLGFDDFWLLLFYSLIVFSTDYSLIICVVLLFLVSFSGKNKQNMISLAKIVDVFFM